MLLGAHFAVDLTYTMLDATSDTIIQPPGAEDMADTFPPKYCRLLDIVHADQKLYLVFEFLDVDLKRYMEHANKVGSPISPDIVKVSVPPALLVPNRDTAVGCLDHAFNACLTRVIVVVASERVRGGEPSLRGELYLVHHVIIRQRFVLQT